MSKILYSHNATVYIAGRSSIKGQQAIESIQSEEPNSSGKLRFLQLDLSDLTTIKQAAEEFMSKESKLHWLDNNAGVMTPPPGSKGAQNLDLQYQTNILGPFLFTKSLLPVLRKTAETEPKGSVRVSWAGSVVIELQSPTGGVQWKDNTLDYGMTNPPTAYGTSKAANYFLAYEFGKRFGDKDGVMHNVSAIIYYRISNKVSNDEADQYLKCYNPGNLKTDLQRHMNPLTVRMAGFTMYDPIFGAYTELYSGLSQELTLEKDQGGYIIPWGRRSTVRKDVEAGKGDDKNSAKLYEWCSRETSKYA